MTHERLQANLNYLAQCFPSLSAQFQKKQHHYPNAIQVHISEGKRGMKTACAEGPNGVKRLHSQYDPVSEGIRWAESLEVAPGSVVFFLGWGLGYPVLEWVERFADQVSAIIVWEPEIELFQKSLEEIDLHRIPNGTSIQFIVGHEEGSVYQALHSVLSHLLSHDVSIQPLPFADIYPREVIDQLKRETQQILMQREAALQHMAQTGYQTQKHIIQNLRYASECWLPHDVYNVGENQPAIIVAAGPSLDNNIGQLWNAMGKSWIFAVDTSLRVLKNHGIEPNFVVTKDFTELNQSHFDGMQNLESPILAFDPQIPPETTSKFIGPKIWLPNRNRQLHKFLKGFELKEVDLLPHSTNVALTAFNLAHVLGCSPIILVGLDLCFSDSNGKSHATHSALVSNVQFDCHTNRMVYTRGEASDTIDALLVEGIDGKHYPTVPNFYEALRLLERLIQGSGIQTIDASEGGAHIQGTEVTALRKAIEQHCQTELSFDLPFEKLPRNQKELQTSLQEIAEFLDETQQMAFDLINQFKDIDCPDCINFATFENQRRGIESDQKVYRLLESALERLLVEIDKPNYFDDGLSPTELMERYATYFSKIEEACVTFAPQFEQCAKALESFPFESTLPYTDQNG